MLATKTSNRDHQDGFTGLAYLYTTLIAEKYRSSALALLDGVSIAYCANTRCMCPARLSKTCSAS